MAASGALTRTWQATCCRCDTTITLPMHDRRRLSRKEAQRALRRQGWSHTPHVGWSCAGCTLTMTFVTGERNGTIWH